MLYYRLISLSCLALAFVAYDGIPAYWGWENSIIEWLQVVVLAIGLILCWKADRTFGLFTAPAWLLLIGRELSWGRVFFPLGIGPNGPYFPALKDLWFGAAVYPINSVILLIWVLAIIRYKLYLIPIRLMRQGQFPWANFGLVFIAALAAYISEKVLHRPASEEIAETVVYTGLIVISLEFYNIMKRSGLLGSSKPTYKNSI